MAMFKSLTSSSLEFRAGLLKLTHDFPTYLTQSGKLPRVGIIAVVACLQPDIYHVNDCGTVWAKD